MYKSKFQDSVQLQTVLALYGQETVRNNGETSYLRSKTSVKLHIDQMMRTRNFRVRNDVVREEQSQRVKKQRKPTLRGKWWSVFSGRHMDNVRKETHVALVMTDLWKETSAVARDEEDEKAKTDGEGENPQEHQATEMKALQTKRAKFRAVTKNCKSRHVVFGILPCVKTTSLRLDANLEENVSSDMSRRKRSPSRSQRKAVRKDQLHY